jgi:hypothetical protein
MSELSCLGSIIRWSVTENDLVDIEEDLWQKENMTQTQ